MTNNVIQYKHMVRKYRKLNKIELIECLEENKKMKRESQLRIDLIEVELQKREVLAR